MKLLLRNDRAVRWMHPAAWWIWALCGATAASITSNPLALCCIIIAALSVVLTRGAEAPWAASMSTLLKIAAVIVVFRIVLQTLLGAPIGLQVVASLPEVALPSWLAGLRLGGAITLESLLLGAVEGMRFAAILLCIAAATTVAAPSRLFRSLPDALAELGTVLMIALTFAPHIVQDFGRIRRAQRLRGRRIRGVRSLVQAIAPVVDGAMSRSVQLAAAMNGRGYGRSRATRHRPDPWKLSEWSVVIVGITAVAATVWRVGPDTQLELAPLQWPSLSMLYVTALMMFALPAFVTPLTPRTV